MGLHCKSARAEQQPYLAKAVDHPQGLSNQLTMPTTDSRLTLQGLAFALTDPMLIDDADAGEFADYNSEERP